MTAADGHAQAVDRLLARAAPGEAVDVLDLLQGALDALWHRSRITLGEMTLIAISERVLYDAAQRFPAFASIRVDAGGMHSDELRPKVASMIEGDLREAARFVLVRWLTVLGSLTAEILTPGLHEELARVSPNRKDAKT